MLHTTFLLDLIGGVVVSLLGVGMAFLQRSAAPLLASVLGALIVLVMVTIARPAESGWSDPIRVHTALVGTVLTVRWEADPLRRSPDYWVVSAGDRTCTETAVSGATYDCVLPFSPPVVVWHIEGYSASHQPVSTAAGVARRY